MKTTNRTLDFTLLLIRIMLGTVVAGHGAQKLFGWFGGFGFDGTVGFFTNVIGLPYFFAVLIILLESFGMIALIFGLFSRVMSGALILIMIGAIFTTHVQFGFFMNWFGALSGEGYEYHLLIITLSAVLVLNGSGAYSLDNVLSKMLSSLRKKENPSMA